MTSEIARRLPSRAHCGRRVCRRVQASGQPERLDTPLVRALPHFDKVRENAEKTTPVPRIGQPEDVADAVAYLVAERAGHVGGDVIHVTGGRYRGSGQRNE